MVRKHIGTQDDDSFVGNRRDELFRGKAGEDAIFGGRGDDTLHGGGDDDYLSGDQDDDFIFGGAGADALYGGGGRDVLYGGRANDRLFNYRGGRDEFYGGLGNDEIITARATKHAWGGEGADTFVALLDEEGEFFTRLVIEDFDVRADRLDVMEWASLGFPFPDDADRVKVRRVDFDGDGKRDDIRVKLFVDDNGNGRKADGAFLLRDVKLSDFKDHADDIFYGGLYGFDL